MQTNTNVRVYAGFFVRLAAFLVDMLIVNAGLLVVRIPKWFLQLSSPQHFLIRDFIFQYSITDILIYLATLAYFVLLTYYTGATLGKRLFQLRVVSTQERDMTFFEVLYRECVGRFLSGVIMNLGYLLILGEKKKRGIHDLLADTCVIYYHEEKVYIPTPVIRTEAAFPAGYRNSGTSFPDGYQNGGMENNGNRQSPSASGNAEQMVQDRENGVVSDVQNAEVEYIRKDIKEQVNCSAEPEDTLKNSNFNPDSDN